MKRYKRIPNKGLNKTILKIWDESVTIADILMTMLFTAGVYAFVVLLILVGGE